MKNYYQILGIEPNANADEIKKAYRKLSLKFHPDKNPDDKYFETRFKEINEAYSFLGNPVKKETYDDELKEFDFINSDLKNAHDYLKQEAEKLRAEREKFEREKAKAKPSPKAENRTYQKPPIVSDDNETVEESKSLMPVFVTILLLVLVGVMIYSNSGASRFESEVTEEPLPAVDSAAVAVDSAAVAVSGQNYAFMKGDDSDVLSDVNEMPLVDNEKYFTIGSSKDEVLEVQGTPDKIINYSAIHAETWFYGRYFNGEKYFSLVHFKYDVVESYNNDNEILKIRLKPSPKYSNSSDSSQYD